MYGQKRWRVSEQRADRIDQSSSSSPLPASRRWPVRGSRARGRATERAAPMQLRSVVSAIFIPQGVHYRHLPAHAPRGEAKEAKQVIQVGKHGHVGRQLRGPAAVSVVVALLMTTVLGAIGQAAAGTWSLAASMSTPRAQYNWAPLLPDGRVLVTGGVGSAGTVLASVEVYSPATNTWAPAAPMRTARCEQTVTLLQDGRVLVVAGVDNLGVIASAELYDPATDTWSPAGSISVARYRHTATLLPNGKVFVTGSCCSSASTELYDPATDTWSPAASMSIPRNASIASLLASGKVLVGGTYLPSPSGSTELYDPATNTWSPAASMIGQRAYNTATTLLDGQILVVGVDKGADIYASSTTELYDPIVNTRASAGNMSSARSQHAATLLGNGQVLVTGGRDASNVPLVSAELYTPSNDGSTPTGTDVMVEPVDPTTGTTPGSVTFSEVTGAGTTSLVTSSSGPPPPSGFKLGTPPTYYEVTTTATFSGSVDVCISYAGISFHGPESGLKLYHFEDPSWVNRTSALDTVNDVICATVTSFSPFAILEPAYVATVQQPISPDGSSVFNAKRGVVPVKFGLALGWEPTCDLPPATIALTRTSDATPAPINASSFVTAADNGANFRISDCQYVYNVGASSIGQGTYLVEIEIDGDAVGDAVFGLK